ncbi:MAG: NAD(P)H-hydrate dehydratase [Christensenellales bacterium]
MNFCVSASVMKESDRLTIEGGVSGDILMQRAAQSVYESVDWTNKKIYILCGKGNNGGDGYALACILAKNNLDFCVFAVGENKSATSKIFIDKLDNLGVETRDITLCDYDCDIIVDCIFGVGFDRQVDSATQKIFDNINASRAYVVSVDIPSGLNSDNGLGVDCVQADLTVAIQSLKRGHLLSYGKDKCGKVVVADIGIEIVGKREYIVDEQYCSKHFAPRRSNTNKGSYGKSVIIGGSAQYVGAVKLAQMGEAALRCGCGLNCVAVPSSLTDNLRNCVVDSTIFAMASRDEHIVFDKPALDRLVQGATAVAVGMGMGECFDDNRAVIGYLLRNFEGSILIDADGLNSLQSYTTLLDDKLAQAVITPHPKEMSRLCGISVSEVLANPVHIAEKFAKEHNVIVLLKGTSTVVTDGQDTYMMTNGTPAQAKGGSGDVLSGVIVGLLARGVKPIEAAATGAFVCADSAKKASEKYGEYGTLASDCVREVGEVVRQLESIAKGRE